MATTRLTDVIVPEVYETYKAVNNPETTAFFDSGIAVRNQMLDMKVADKRTQHIDDFEALFIGEDTPGGDNDSCALPRKLPTQIEDYVP